MGRVGRKNLQKELQNTGNIISVTMLCLFLLMGTFVGLYLGGIINFATYSFNGQVGLENNDIPFVSWSRFGDDRGVRIISNKEGRKNVLQIWDNSSTQYPSLVHNFDSSKGTGYVSFYFLVTNPHYHSYFYFWSNTDTPMITTRVVSNMFEWYLGSTSGKVGVSANRWYLYELEWDYIDSEGNFNDYVSLKLDGDILYNGTWLGYKPTSITGLESFGMIGNMDKLGYSVYIDDFNEKF